MIRDFESQEKLLNLHHNSLQKVFILFFLGFPDGLLGGELLLQDVLLVFCFPTYTNF